MEKNVCPLCGCSGCGSDEQKDEQKVEKNVKRFKYNDNELAILLALVPAMTLSLFNLMGLV